MKWKAALRHYLRDFKKPILLFYGIVAGLFFLQLLLARLLKEEALSGGMESATSIFLFVLGLGGFKSHFRLFLQNGLSRKTLYVGFVAALCTASAAMTATDLLLGWLRGPLAPYTSVYMGRFASLYPAGGSAKALAEEALWGFLSHAAAGMTGFFLASLYYRMGKALKLAVSIGVPMLAFIILPLVDGLYLKGALTALFVNVSAFALGYGLFIRPVGNLFDLIMELASTVMERGVPLHPYRAVAFSAMLSAAGAAFSFLLVRRATVKD